ncbi:MAG: SRPBCC domain-containing protein [Chloroflexota bacterium]
MADILHAVEVQASAEKIYKAITEQDGLIGWWSQHSKIEPSEGAMASVGFYGGMVTFEFSVDELDANHKVVWSLKNGPPDWLNTKITWTLTEEEGKTLVYFAHTGFANMEGNFAGVNYNWGWYLTSLKFYIEKGAGTPHTDADLPS